MIEELKTAVIAIIFVSFNIGFWTHRYFDMYILPEASGSLPNQYYLDGNTTGKLWIYWTVGWPYFLYHIVYGKTRKAEPIFREVEKSKELIV